MTPLPRTNSKHIAERQRAANNLRTRKRNKRTNIRKCLFPQTQVLFDAKGNEYPYPSRCNICWNCEQTRKDDLIGRVAAHVIGCAHVQFWTLTYDSKRGLHQRLSAKMRWVKDLQDFKKALRQREQRGLKTYNKRETKAALKEGREPKLVDTSKSYIKFIDTHEIGTKSTKRSHWHVMILFEAHFPVSGDIYLQNDLKIGLQNAKRVWDLKTIYGPEARYRRETQADNPDVIDFRVKENANQEHGLWPHGQINVKSMTHDVYRSDPILKGDAGIGKGVEYLNKYVDKMRQKPDGLHWDQRRWTREDFKEYARSVVPNVSKTQSFGIGFPYARAFGRERGKLGVPVDDFTYQINQMTNRRKPQTAALRDRQLQAAGLSAVHAQSLTDHRMTYSMRGVMRREVVEGWLQTAPPNEQQKIEERAGDAFRRAMFEAESENAREFLNSLDAEILRFLQSDATKQLKPLKAELTPVHCYETENGELQNKPGKEKFRTIADRLKERRAEIAEIKAQYAVAAAQEHESRVQRRLKHLVSVIPVKNLDTEVLFKARPKVERERYRREADVQYLARLRQQLAAETLDPEKVEELALLDERLAVHEREQFQLDRYTLYHSCVTSGTLWHWINTSDDYDFHLQREELIKTYCEVFTPYPQHDPDFRVVINPKGIWYGERSAIMPMTRKAYCDASKEFITHRNYRRWATRRLTQSEIAQIGAQSGEKVIIDLHSREPVFTGPMPLKRGLPDCGA